MADRVKRKRESVDYSLLNKLTTADVYFVRQKKYYRPRSKTYEVERLISRRKCGKDYEYLIKWKGWSMRSCSWEPSSHLTEELKRNYLKPPRPVETELQQASDALYLEIVSLLKSNAVNKLHSCYFLMKHDIYRFCFQGKGTPSRDPKYSMFCLKDFERLLLPHHWWYILDEHGQGKAVHFPIKMKEFIGKSPKHYIVHGSDLVLAPNMVLEKVSLTINIKALKKESLVVV